IAILTAHWITQILAASWGKGRVSPRVLSKLEYYHRKLKHHLDLSLKILITKDL
ncbi:hypothetical protein CEXT_175271, partial [Caerostris extrusa]